MEEEGLTTPRQLRAGYSPSLGALNSDDDSFLDSPGPSDYDDASMDNAPALFPRSRMPKRSRAERSPQQGPPPRGVPRPRAGETPLRVRLLPDGPSRVRVSLSASPRDGGASPPSWGGASPLINLISQDKDVPETRRQRSPPATTTEPARRPDPPPGTRSTAQRGCSPVRTTRTGSSASAAPAIDDVPAEYDGGSLPPRQGTLLRNLPIDPSPEELGKLSVPSLRALLYANGVGSTAGRPK